MRAAAIRWLTRGRGSAAEGEGLYLLRFEDAAEQLAGAFGADLVRLKAKGSGEQPLFQDGSGSNRDTALQRGGQHSQGDDGQQQEHPLEEPRAIDAAM